MLGFLRRAATVDADRSDAHARRAVPAAGPTQRWVPRIEELEERIVPANTLILQETPLVTQQLFPSTYPTNNTIVNAPVAANSATLINEIATGVIGGTHVASAAPTVFVNWNAYDAASTSQSYGMWYNVVHSKDTTDYQMVKVYLDNYPGDSNVSGADANGQYVLVPMPKAGDANVGQLVIEGDNVNGSANASRITQGNDSHMLIYDADTGLEYEFWHTVRPTETSVASASGFLDAVVAGQWNAANEATFDMSSGVPEPIPAPPADPDAGTNSSSFRSIGADSADAAGLSILENIARPDEALPAADGGQGVVNHALRFTLESSFVEGGEFVYPANHVTSGSGTLPYGTRFRLEDTPAVNALIAEMGPESQVLARAMQQYGLILADIGSDMFVQAAETSNGANNIPLVDPVTGKAMTWNMNDLLGQGSFTTGLQDIPTTDFQIVNLTPVVSSVTASSGAAGSTITITGVNFSGSGGNLSVLFAPLGGTSPGVASPTVTFVSDTQITAVVPAGAGTVDVRVVSGYTGTAAQDNENGNGENVKGNAFPGGGPIYGYGVSAVVAADQFTYTTQTVSATNSSVSWANPTVASGGADAVTVVVKDTTGNAITGLNSSAFQLTLSGGASAGTFGAVAETSTPGTYTATFTATTPGTTSTLTATVSGVIINTKPKATVVLASSSNSTVVLASPVVSVGATDIATIVVEDAAGNAVSGLGSGSFSFSFSGGASDGTVSGLTETSTLGTYTALLTGAVVGSPSAVVVEIGSVAVSNPPTLRVIFTDTFATVGPNPGPNYTVGAGLDQIAVTAPGTAADTAQTIEVGLEQVNTLSLLNADVDAFVDVGATGDAYSAVFARRDAAGDMYVGMLGVNTTGSPHNPTNQATAALLFRFQPELVGSGAINGGWTFLTYTLLNTPPDTGRDDLRLDVFGTGPQTTLTLSLNGAAVLSYNESETPYAGDLTPAPINNAGGVGLLSIFTGGFGTGGTAAPNFSVRSLEAPPVPFADAFTRPNANTLGSPWRVGPTPPQPAPPGGLPGGQFAVVDDFAQAAASVNSYATLYGTSFLSVQESVVVESLGGAARAGLLANWSSPTSGYEGVLTSSNGGTAEILKNGVVLASTSGVGSSGLLSFTVANSGGSTSLQLFLNGTLAVSTSDDSPFTTPGLVGIESVGGGSSFGPYALGSGS